MKKLTLYSLALGLVLALGVVPCRGQSGNSTNPEPEDPTGNAGTVKSTVETGGGYNAHNGNASRSITDLQVPGAPGVYGLDFTRHWNSTDPEFSPFGAPGPRPFGNGGWSHSWNWSAAVDIKTLYCDGETNQCSGGYYVTYIHYINIEYPDGRTARFWFSRTNLTPPSEDPDPGSPEPYPATGLTGGLGVDDHLDDISADGNSFWLYLADGGSVFFQWFNLGYRATQVVDPHGLATNLTYESDTFGDRLRRVAGPDGRSIFLEYGSLGDNPSALIRKVGWGVNPGSYLQTVEYDYSHYTIPDPANAGASFHWYTLTGVRYMDDINAGQLVQASYTYTPFATHDTTPLTPSPQGRGALLTTADDPRFEGPMTRIRYVFRGAPPTGGEPFCQSVNPAPWPGNAGPSMMYAPFPVEKELSLDTGEMVSQLWIPCNGQPLTGMRTEYRGAGGARTFQFGKKGGLEPGATWDEIPNGPDVWHPPEADPGSGTHGYNAGFEITRLTDFADNPDPATMPTDFHHNFRLKPWRSFDARGILTQYKYQTGNDYPGPSGNGRVKEVWHRGADQTKRTYNWDNPTPGSEQRDGIHIPNPYNHWLFSQTDERNNTTTYTRDRLRRVTRITYYDHQGNQVAVESFTYNDYNQVTSHTLPSGAVKHYGYNGSFLALEWNSVDGVAAGTLYVPDSLGRVFKAQNARAWAAGKEYSAKMEYNSRHQVTKVHYPSTGGSSDPTVIYEYDKYGNCTAITNEKGYRSTYTYDPYGRCVSYTEPVNAPACGGSSVGSRTWEWVYDRIATDGPRDASTHTSKKWRLQIEPAYNVAGDRRATVRHYDYNDRLSFEFIGAIVSAGGGWNFDHGAFHPYEYDANGNKTKYTDPRGRVTDYVHDNRNRVITTTEVRREGQTVPQVTVTDYDATGNKTLVRFPDQRTQQWLYHDPFGQPRQFKDERGNTTYLDYWPWGPMKQLQLVTTRRTRDGSGAGTEDQRTSFYPDQLGRPGTTVFPDQSSEITLYQHGQVKSWKTRKDALKTITAYDARGRETAHTWSDGTPGVTRIWDDANRLIVLANSVSSIDYGYDQAGQMREEGTAIMGALGQSPSGRKEVSYCRYPNGEISRITYPNGLNVQRTYTARGQLESVNWSGASGGSVSYDYFPDGKPSELQYGNGVHTGVDYDARGFTRVVHHQSPQGNISHRTYWRDDRDRIIGWAKSGSGGMNPKENGRGDRYQYDEEGQLYLASYEVENPEGGGTGPMRTDIFTYDEMGNRMGTQNHVASRGWMEFKRRNNGLNQYGEWYSIIHHDDHFAPNQPGKANGVLMMEGWIGASFNALNQPIAMYSGSTLPEFVWFGYDPLGRCVKRWLGNDQGEAPESEGGYAPGSPNPVAMYLYYDGWNLVQEGTAADSPTLLYVHGGRVDEVVAQIKPQTNTLRYLQYDARGHCVFQTDTSGQIEEQYEYDAFGLPYFFDGSGDPMWANGYPGSEWGNRILFTGREYLSDMRIYDFRNRVYHPELGRFLQPDPKQFEAGDYNLYRYCHNDPVNKTDPLGLKPGDPFDSPEEAARDVHNFINPTSIKQNAEYGSVIYRVGDNFYASPTFTNGAQTHVTLGSAADKSRIPKEVRSRASREGDYHSHGDYSKIVINPKDGSSKIERASKSENPESDHPSEGDYHRAGAIHKELPKYKLFLGTPSKELKKYNSKKEIPL